MSLLARTETELRLGFASPRFFSDEKRLRAVCDRAMKGGAIAMEMMVAGQSGKHS